jgi:hypothetical protein
MYRSVRRDFDSEKLFMAITKDDLDAFHQFAEAKLASRGAEKPV